MLPRERPSQLILFGSLLLGFAARAYVVFNDEGINWPDEIYQSFEPAHRLVFGYGMVAWEYLDGARTWGVPGFVSIWLFLCKLFGATSPGSYIHLTKLVFSALSCTAALGVYRLARQFGARELEASLSAAVWNLCALALYFSPRAMSENLAAVCIVWGLAFALPPKAAPRELIIGGSLLGLATIFRLQSGMVCLAIVLVFAARAARSRDWKPLLQLFGTLTVWALVFGAWDAAAWHDVPRARFGGWFHSAFVYYDENIVKNRGAAWGVADAGYYFRALFTSMPGVTLALGVTAIASWKRAPAMLFVLAAFIALHLKVPHKELRFMIPIMPVACALIGVALSLLPRQPARLGLALISAVTLYSFATASRLTMGDVGSYPERAGSSAWNDFGPVNRLMMAASTHDDLCGLRVDAHLAWAGGITYLHRNAPLYMPGTPHQYGWFNYVITRGAQGVEVLAQDNGWQLIKLPGVDTCNPNPNYSWKLP